MPTDTPSTQGAGSKGQTLSFSESSHVAYQIKAYDAGSNMVANNLPTDTPLLTIYFDLSWVLKKNRLAVPHLTAPEYMFELMDKKIVKFYAQNVYCLCRQI